MQSEQAHQQGFDAIQLLVIFLCDLAGSGCEKGSPGTQHGKIIMVNQPTKIGCNKLAALISMAVAISGRWRGGRVSAFAFVVCLVFGSGPWHVASMAASLVL